ncbi:conserved hypothetical protein [Verticillium alfalfae VaMs.102]|uniref:Uncharacterized protein n=1 Tax=Verticillium alfalfae (strain VaMs.102 / ATCC MYA-4576 / FGSC 10136) TaxID=526221 RepID=C9S5Q1_VERA1|nr:conserved hypothetical protein [Verticillium alfalfae VaMs.102]EEY14277.1 conserved hypothetical protein [Verticillium alfalfae VaMs.102]
MTSRPPNHDMTEEELSRRRNFKKHKVLPHPLRQRENAGSIVNDQRSPQARRTLSSSDAQSRKKTSQSPNSPTLKHQSRRIRSGPVMPPTPPAHSRTSSSSHSIQLHSPTDAATPSQSLEKVSTHLERPTTPQNQQSPPTPDVTPPQPAARPKALRPVFGDRSISKTTTSESRTESFRTAREEPYSSEDDCKSTIRPSLPSPRTSQTTVLQISQHKVKKASHPSGIGLGLDFDPKTDDSLTPRTKGEFIKFDAGWESSNEVEKEWDDNLGRHVMVRKTRKTPETPHTPRLSEHGNEVFDDDLISPSNATKALRAVPLHDRMTTHPVAKHSPERKIAKSKPAALESFSAPDHRRLSGTSAKSSVSTVVEAILVDTPSPPQRQQTLRHVRKRGTLRDSPSDQSPGGSAPSSAIRLEETRQHPPASRPPDSRRESHTSATTHNSMSSNKARREVWKNGGIPVVVVPDRRSSNRPSRRRRTMSESDGSDQRTIDYPPAIPARSSSLSAPTSRNTSRAGSMTAESLRAHNAVQQRLTSKDRMISTDLKSTPSFFSAQEDYMHARPNLHRPDAESYSGKRLSHQNTPFSVASLDTNGSFGTAAEVSEALAVSIYPHQNSSLLMVHHAVKPNDDGDVFQDRAATENNDSAPEMPGSTPARPKIVTTSPGGSVPVTPPQTQLALEQVDSPLKNPRAPPVPPTLPAIQFIPATPSGLTPFHERQEMRGNYFEAMEEDEKPPKRSMSLVRRALLQHRRTSEAYPPRTARPGFLTRTLSLSRSNRGNASTEPLARDSPYPNIDDPPADDSKLHPFWRPTYADDEEDDYVRDIDDEDYYYEAHRNRPGPQRSLSARMKRTFAILPQRDQHGYRSWSGEDGLDRRIIRRTPSGNLRVVRRRKSAESIPRQSDRPYTSDGTSSSRLLWPARSRPRGETPSTPRRRFSVSHTIEEIQGLPRRLSERRRERRTHELRQKISGPREVRDGVGEVVRSSSQRSHR